MCNYNTFSDAARDIYVPGQDHDPERVVVGNVEYLACGPTTGEWVSANRMEEVVEVGGVTFALPRHDD